MIQVKGKLTGRVGYISEDKFNPNLYEAIGGNQPAPAMQTPTMQPMGTQQESGGFLGNLVSSLASPFVRTAQRAGGVAEGLTRLMLNNRIKKAQESGDQEEVNRLLEMATRSSPLVAEGGKMQQELTNPLGVTKDVAGILSWGLPFGGGAKVFGKALPTMSKVGGGALGGAFGGFGYSDEESLGGLAKDTAVGGATGAVLSKLLAGKAKPVGEAGEQGTLYRWGKSLNEGAVNPQVKTGPKMYSEAQKIIEAHNKFGLTGSPENKIKQVDGIYKYLNEQIEPVLKASKAAILESDFETRLKDIMLEKGGQYSGQLGEDNIILQQLKRVLKGKTPADALTAKDLLNFKRAIPSSGWNKSNLTDKEALFADLYHAIDELLTEMEPGIKELTSLQHELYQIVPGLVEKSKQKLNLGIPFFTYIRARAPMRGLDVASDKLSRLLTEGGSKQEAVSSIRSGTADKLASFMKKEAPVIGGAVSANIGGQPAPAYQGQDVYQEPTKETTPETGMTLEQIQKLALADFAQTGGKNLAKIKSLADLFAVGSEKKLTEAEVARKQAADGTTRALAMLQAGSVSTGLVLGPLENIKGKFGVADKETLEFNTLISSIKANIAKARAGTSFTPNEERMLNRYTPNIGDSYQELKTKLEGLKNMGL